MLFFIIQSYFLRDFAKRIGDNWRAKPSLDPSKSLKTDEIAKSAPIKITNH